jgi:Transglutaminase-like superfamily
MKWIITITFLLYNLPAITQEQPDELARQLTANGKTELEKVTSIFKWITGHVSYRVKPDKKLKRNKSFSVKNVNEEYWIIDDEPLKSLNERVAEDVLKNKKAVCDGYARLFKTLCDHAGINSEIILGYARSRPLKSVQRFGVNHYWNAVMIDNKWYLLDATWASGYVSMQGDVFIREYDEHYFLTPPEVFIQDHYPDDIRWTLLPDSKIPLEFYRSPFKQKSFSKYQITSFYPSGGIIETFVGDTIRLNLQTNIKETGRVISPDMLVDSTLFTHSSSWVFLKPDQTENSNLQIQYNYLYAVSSPKVEWLYLLYNDDMVLRYKIKVK